MNYTIIISIIYRFSQHCKDFTSMLTDHMEKQEKYTTYTNQVSL